MIDLRRRFAIRSAGLAALALALSSCGSKAERFLATDITGADWGRDFRLTDHTGRPRTLADFRGKVVMLFFGYTHCPDECPTTLAKMARAVDRLGKDGKRVQGLFVTVDPKRDTQDVLAKYVLAFYPGFIGLRGSESEVARTAKEFKVFFAPERPEDSGLYTVDHSAAIFVFDPQGRLRLLMNGDTGVEAMVHDLRLLLQQ